MRNKLVAIFALFLVVAAFWVFELDHPIAEVDPKYTNVASQFLALPDGTRVHFRDQGDPAGYPLVLLHGSNASLHTWEPWVAQLGTSYRVVTLDLPGHGLTGRTPSDDYSNEAYIKTVAAVTQHLQLDRFVLGGNSMGGGVTWRYALAHPEQVSAMVLVSASGLPAWRGEGRERESRERESRDTDKKDRDTDKKENIKESGRDVATSAPLAFRLLRQSWFQSIARYIDPYYLVAQGLRASHFDASMVDEALIARYYDLSVRAGTRDATLKRFASFGSDSPDLDLDLSELHQPTLVLWGEHDNVIPSSTALRFRAALMQADVVIYPDVGHIAMEEVPVRSATDVRRFLAEHQL